MRIDVLKKELGVRRERVARALEEFISEAKKLGMKKVVLYGSTARGEDRADSDVDLLLIGKRRERDRIVDIETDIDLKYGVPLISTIRESESDKSPFVKKIMEEGIVLYG